MNTRCSAHGLLPWLGHGWCVACQKLYRRILSAPVTCSCGERLLPDVKLIVEKLFEAVRSGRGDFLSRELAGYKVDVEGRTAGSFTGRPLCAKCYESCVVDEAME